MVVALIALFVALSGTGYAALKVDGKNIRKRSIPANKIKRDSLGASEINEAKLGVVPAAARAESLAGRPPSAFLGAAAKAANADKLDGIDSAGFLASGAKAVDADKLDGVDSAGFLAANAKAADADQLDGVDSAGFVHGDGELFRSAGFPSPGATQTLTTSLAVIRYTCPNPIGGAGSLSYQNVSAGAAPTWIDTGAGVTFDRVGVSALTVATPVGQSHISVGSLHQLSPDRTVQADIYVHPDAGFVSCDVYMFAVVN
jgi:hypothetical protein